MVYRNFMFTAASTVGLLSLYSMTPVVSALSITDINQRTGPLSEVQSTTIDRTGRVGATTQAKVGTKAQASGQADAKRNVDIMTWFKDIKDPAILDDRPA